MKNFKALIIAFAVAVAGLSAASTAYALDVQYKETVLDQAWDWATTLGKSGLEKETILAQNKAERMKRHAEKLAKQAEKEAGQAASDMKKKLGF